MIQVTSSEKQGDEIKPKQKWGKKEKIIAGIALMFLFISLLIISGGERKQTPTPHQTIQYITQAGTPERAIEEKIVQILGEKTNTGERKIREITVENDRIFIDFIADENLTINLTRGGIWTDITDLLEKLPAQIDPKIEYLIFQAYFPLVDKYGRVSIDRVMLVTVARKTWEKIEWDNFLRENLPKIADSYWEHPALSK